MTTQTAINIPDDLVAELYRRAPQPDARTALIAEALRCFFATHDAANSDLEILNRYADELNQEAEDVLDYQVIPGNAAIYTGFRIHRPVTQGDPEFSLWGVAKCGLIPNFLRGFVRRFAAPNMAFSRRKRKRWQIWRPRCAVGRQIYA